MTMHTILLPTLGADSTFLVASVLMAAGFVHGSVGFAFAMISTPILAMWMDLSSAILITLFPTIFINAASIGTIRGWQKMAQKHISFVLLALMGSVLGTLILLAWDARWMKLLLALMIFLYLALGKLRVEFDFVNRSPRTSLISFALIGGMLGGITNNMSPILIIYALTKRYPKEESIVFMNLSFLLGKLSQIAVFLLMGRWLGLTTLLYTTAAALGGFYLGAKVRKHIPERTYVGIVKGMLLLIAVAIVIRYLYTS